MKAPAYRGTSMSTVGRVPAPCIAGKVRRSRQNQRAAAYGVPGSATAKTCRPETRLAGPIIADSDEVARAFRDDVARCSDMMSPGVRCLAG